mgnify:CR=1 FL=1
MVRVENLEAKLASLRRTLALVRTFRGRAMDEIRADAYLRGALERYLFLAVQGAIDLAEMLCSLKGYGRAESMTQGFALLEAAGVIPGELAASLRQMVGLRNALVQGYEHLNYAIVEDALRVRVEDIEEFARLVDLTLTA